MFIRRLTPLSFPVCLLGFLFATVAGSALAESDDSGLSPDLIPPASAHAVLTAGKHRISYIAGWSEIGISGPDGKPQGTVSATSYVLSPLNAS